MLKLVVFSPLVASILAGSCYRWNCKTFSQIVTILGVFISWLLSLKFFWQFDGSDLHENLLTWIEYNNFVIEWGVYADRLTLVMLVIITSVSLFVHIYSVGYMKEDPSVPRFMSYLSLFTFAMLLLVTSNNLLQLFAGWEGVGACSYLLIGYWYKKESANNASIKAFIVNRVGDAAFILGILTIYGTFNTLQFKEIFELLPGMIFSQINILGNAVNVLDLICILLFIGSMGKSAQLGLHTWLADAMEGPTPVSALIHAATMVTAGIFLVVRSSPLYEYSEVARNLVLIVGSVTCLFGAIVAITQNDIKKIIAYSTCSQLGYMFIACGAQAYNAGIFHLLTHAFFKSLLFLGAGSVIHALDNEQGIRKMGGLWKKLPLTHLFMLIGSIAIMGLYPLSGYFSKDSILEATYVAKNHYGRFGFICGIIGAFCTAFYSSRLFIKVFYGKKQYSEEKHLHESPLTMAGPMSLLSIAAVLVGWIFFYHYNILEPDFWVNAIIVKSEILHDAEQLPAEIKFLPMIVSILAVGLAAAIYSKPASYAEDLSHKFSPLYKLSSNKFYFDEIYQKLFVRSFIYISQLAAKIIDKKLIDHFIVDNSWYFFKGLSKYVSKIHTGYVYHYVFVMIFSMVLILTYVILR
jgi:NADH-quinone oxidoreductase subunit L